MTKEMEGDCGGYGSVSGRGLGTGMTDEEISGEVETNVLDYNASVTDLDALIKILENGDNCEAEREAVRKLIHSFFWEIQIN